MTLPVSVRPVANRSVVNRSVSDRPIVFFDGICGLCDRFVRFVLKRDREEKFLFSPLQGETAGRFAGVPPGGGAIVLAEGGGVFCGSDAVIRTVAGLGGVWRLAGVLIYIPRRVRDFFYARVAARRYEWFGRFDSPVLPPGGFSGRFLP